MSALIEMHHICKTFGAVQALRDVNLWVNAGEVLGLIGDNAAGKSTLMKILTGAYRADAGEIQVDGNAVRFRGPEDSRAAGIEMVYQDLALVGSLDVPSNVFLGRELVKWQWGPFKALDKAAMRARTSEMLGRLHISVPNPAETAEHLSGGQRQAVAIGRALAFDARLVILDEPTAALSIAAIASVHRMVRSLKAHRCGVILISHRLDDIIAVCDRVMVLRHGQVAAVRTVVKNHDDEFRQVLIRDIEGIRDADQDSRWGERSLDPGASCGVAAFS